MKGELEAAREELEASERESETVSERLVTELNSIESRYSCLSERFEENAEKHDRDLETRLRTHENLEAELYEARFELSEEQISRRLADGRFQKANRQHLRSKAHALEFWEENRQKGAELIALKKVVKETEFELNEERAQDQDSTNEKINRLREDLAILQSEKKAAFEGKDQAMFALGHAISVSSGICSCCLEAKNLVICRPCPLCRHAVTGTVGFGGC